MVQHEMKVLSYMFKMALSISLLSFISDSQSLLMGESFLCCKTEYIFVSTPTISKSNIIFKSYFSLGASLIKLILGRGKKIAEMLKFLVHYRFSRCLWVSFLQEKKKRELEIFYINAWSIRSLISSRCKGSAQYAGRGFHWNIIKEHVMLLLWQVSPCSSWLVLFQLVACLDVLHIPDHMKPNSAWPRIMCLVSTSISWMLDSSKSDRQQYSPCTLPGYK